MLNNAGSDAVFGNPCRPEEGHLTIPFPSTSDGSFILRVMDYDWGKKDDLLGEILIKAGDIASLDHSDRVLTLQRKGSTSDGSTITLAAYWLDNASEIPYISNGSDEIMRYLRIVIKSANHL